jgi:hypothetical protein
MLSAKSASNAASAASDAPELLLLPLRLNATVPLLSWTLTSSPTAAAAVAPDANAEGGGATASSALGPLLHASTLRCRCRGTFGHPYK